ncbi:MAG: AmpG family muropeptide MFS transporter [Succinivibrio sp.]|nr:AmpG family muropeptide MFS transporter [Succinivibrio sp.]
MSETKPAKRSLLSELFSRRMGICIVLGFSSGLPLFVLLNLMSAWMQTEGVDLKTIGVMSLVMFPYTWKFLWAPLTDRFNLLGLGRRRSWMLLMHVLVLLSVAMLGQLNPQAQLFYVVTCAFVLAFSSATLDIAIDAYRRELLTDRELGLGNSLFVNAYRASALIPGSLSLILADLLPWSTVFWITAAFMLPGLALTCCLKEHNSQAAPRTLSDAVVKPWAEFMSRHGVKSALLVLAFVFLYKLGDSMCTALATPFYLKLGYTKTTIGIVAKNAGLWCSILGALLGGIWMLRLGINKALWIFGAAQLIAIAGFAYLAKAGEAGTPSIWLLTVVVGSEALGVGLGTAAFVAFICAQTNKAYTATQLALLTSLSAVPRTFCNATTGFLVDNLGWVNFYLLCMLLAIPGMLLLFKVAPFHEEVLNLAEHREQKD